MTYNVGEVILKVENVNLTYDKPILRDINFEIHNITRPNICQGQIVSLIGRSGIGKTQLFKILSGMHKPDTGYVKIGEHLLPVRAGDVGVVPQNYILFNHRTIMAPAVRRCLVRARVSTPEIPTTPWRSISCGRDAVDR